MAWPAGRSATSPSPFQIHDWFPHLSFSEPLANRSMTSRLENTASRAAPAKTQQRASSIGRSMKIHSSTGLFFARDSRSPSSKQLFQAISRQATLAGFRDSISAFKASAVFFAGVVVGAAPARQETNSKPTVAAIVFIGCSPLPETA